MKLNCFLSRKIMYMGLQTYCRTSYLRKIRGYLRLRDTRDMHINPLQFRFLILQPQLMMKSS